MKKRGQVWIETVIYTLIAFILIGTVLAFVKPKIDELQDKAIIEQSISLMKDLDISIQNILVSPGNKRELELEIKKGGLQIDGDNDELNFEIESRYLYSEPGEVIPDGNILIKTEKKGSFNLVTLTRNYSDYNITYDGIDQVKTISQATTSYKLFVENRGQGVIDVTLG